MPLRIQSNQRLAIIGMTGSGKTEFAKQLVKPLRRLVLFDPKGEMDAKEWNFTEWNQKAYDHLKGSSKNVGRYRVLAPINQDWEPFCKQIYEVRNITLYIDEMYGVTQGKPRPGNWLNALYTRGRTLGIGVWAATQRPRNVPVVMLTGAEWAIVFRLQSFDDRIFLSRIYGERLRYNPRADYGFWLKYYRWSNAEESAGITIPQKGATNVA